MFHVDKDKLKKFMKFTIHFFIVLMAIKLVSNYQLENKQIFTIGVISVISFVILDLYAPSVENFNSL